MNSGGITAPFICAFHLLKGSEVIGQLTAQLFHGQMCVIPSFHSEGADVRLESISSVVFVFGSW